MPLKTILSGAKKDRHPERSAGGRGAHGRISAKRRAASGQSYRLQKGEPVAVVENYYSENCEQVSIPMDVSLSPAQNAQRYFKLYQRRAARGRLRQNKRKKPSRNSNIWSRWRTICANARMRAGCRNCGDARRLRPCAPAVLSRKAEKGSAVPADEIPFLRRH